MDWKKWSFKWTTVSWDLTSKGLYIKIIICKTLPTALESIRFSLRMISEAYVTGKIYVTHCVWPFLSFIRIYFFSKWTFDLSEWDIGFLLRFPVVSALEKLLINLIYKSSIELIEDREEQITEVHCEDLYQCWSFWESQSNSSITKNNLVPRHDALAT